MIRCQVFKNAWHLLQIMLAQGAKEPQKLLTIGGSDSGGAAGIQADLKTWTALAVYGMSAITAVTAQNSEEVLAVQFLSPQFLSDQIDAVLTDYGAEAVKTGFIGKSDLITLISQKLRAYRPPYIVIDPVLVNHKRQAMFPHEVIAAYRQQLLPLATLLTPNWTEALLLSDLPLTTPATPQNIEKALSALHVLSQAAILFTGIEQGDFILDILSEQEQKQEYRRLRIDTENRHGSGDTLSAAIAAYLAQGKSIADSIIMAQQFTINALIAAKNWKLGRGHGPLSHFGNHS